MKKFLIPMITCILIVIMGISIFFVIRNKQEFCINHVDENKDMFCDKCNGVLPYTDYIIHTNLKENFEDGTYIEVVGNMLPETSLKASKIPLKDYERKAKEMLSGDFIEIEDAIDLKLVENEKEYQPITYGQEVEIIINNKKLNANVNYSILHLKEDGSSEFLNATVDEKNNLYFKTSSFSVFLVIKVAGKKVSFTGEHVKIYDLNLKELTSDVVVASNSNFEFIAMADEGYGIEPVKSTETNISCSGIANSKKFLVKSITSDMTISISTVLEPNVTIQPVSVKTKYEVPIQLTVTAENATTYQWQLRRIQNGHWENAVGTGSTSKNFKPNVENYDTYEYRCLIGNAAFTGNDRMISDTVLVSTVIDFARVYEKPIIVEQKAVKQKVKIGEEKAVYEVTAKGNDLTFTWQYTNKIDGFWQNVSSSLGSVKNTVISNTNGTKITKSVLTTSVANNSFSFAEFRCVVNNPHFKLDSGVKSDNMLYLAVQDDNATKLIYKKIEFLEEPASIKCTIGENAEFTVDAVGVDCYKWQYKKNQEEEFWQDVDSKIGMSNDIASGYNTKTLRIDTSQMTYNSETQKYENNLSGYLFRCLVNSSAVPTLVRESDVAMLICVEEQEYANAIIYKKYGVITLKLSSQNGKKGKELLNVNLVSDNKREITMKYIGDLLQPIVEVSLSKKIADTKFEKVNDIENYLDVYNIINGKKLQISEDGSCYRQNEIENEEKYSFTFLTPLPLGTYRLTFTLKDVRNKEVATEAFEIEVE